MAKKKILLRSKQIETPQSVAAFLRELADKVETGQVVLIQEGAETSINLPEQMTLSLSVKEKHKPKKSSQRHSLTIKLKWWEGAKARRSGELKLG
jgi:amphi-Trp domain-containing protein